MAKKKVVKLNPTAAPIDEYFRLTMRGYKQFKSPDVEENEKMMCEWGIGNYDEKSANWEEYKITKKANK